MNENAIKVRQRKLREVEEASTRNIQFLQDVGSYLVRDEKN